MYINASGVPGEQKCIGDMIIFLNKYVALYNSHRHVIRILMKMMQWPEIDKVQVTVSDVLTGLSTTASSDVAKLGFGSLSYD